MRARARADGVCRRIGVGACKGRVVGQPSGYPRSSGGTCWLHPNALRLLSSIAVPATSPNHHREFQ